jgi:hypothetical protein
MNLFEVVFKFCTSIVLLSLLSVLFLTGCGHKNNADLIDLNQEADLWVSPKAVIEIDTCDSLQGQLICNCIDRIAYKHCGSLMVEQNNKYPSCIAQFLESAYNRYCTISKYNAYSDITPIQYYQYQR